MASAIGRAFSPDKEDDGEATCGIDRHPRGRASSSYAPIDVETREITELDVVDEVTTDFFLDPRQMWTSIDS